MFKINSLSHSVNDFLSVSDIQEDNHGRITLVLERPSLCGVCGVDCGFVREGFYHRTAATLLGIILLCIQSYECRGKTDKRYTFSALPFFLRRYSPYALDFYTAVLLFTYRDDLSEAEIEQEINKQTHSLGFAGPRIKTILRWLSRFRGDAQEHTSFFTQKLSEHHFDLPLVLPPDEQAAHGHYASLYFLECLSALTLQLHPKGNHACVFLWYANALLLSHGKRGLFLPRRPP